MIGGAQESCRGEEEGWVSERRKEEDGSDNQKGELSCLLGEGVEGGPEAGVGKGLVGHTYNRPCLLQMLGCSRLGEDRG